MSEKQRLKRKALRKRLRSDAKFADERFQRQSGRRALPSQRPISDEAVARLLGWKPLGERE